MIIKALLTTSSRFSSVANSSLAAQFSKVRLDSNTVDPIKTSFLARSFRTGSPDNYSNPDDRYLQEDFDPNFVNHGSYRPDPILQFQYRNEHNAYSVDGRTYRNEVPFRPCGESYGSFERNPSVNYDGRWGFDQYNDGPYGQDFDYVSGGGDRCFDGNGKPMNRIWTGGQYILSPDAYHREMDARHLPGEYGGNYVQQMADSNGFYRRGWNSQPHSNMDHYGSMIGNSSGPQPLIYVDCGGDWNSNLYPGSYRQNFGDVYCQGDGVYQGYDQPEDPNWYSRQYPQRRDSFYREIDGRDMPNMGVHRSDYDSNWSSEAAIQNQGIIDDCNIWHQSNMHDNPGDARFDKYEYPSRTYGENLGGFKPETIVSSRSNWNANASAGQDWQNLGDMHDGSRRKLQGNDPEKIRTSPQDFQNEIPSKASSKNMTGLRHRSAPHSGGIFYGSPNVEGQRYPGNGDLRTGGSLQWEKVCNLKSGNAGYTQNWDGERWSTEYPNSRSVRAHKNLDYPHQSHDALGLSQGNLDVEGSENTGRQLPQAESNDSFQNMGRYQQRSRPHNSDQFFVDGRESGPDPNLNKQYLSTDAYNPSRLSPNGSPIVDPETAKIKGTVEELEDFTKSGKLRYAVKVLELMDMKKEHLDLDHDMPKVVQLIRACGDSKAVTEAKALHKHIVNLMTPFKFSIYNKILDMYLKCGAIEDAFSMFNNMVARNLTSWDTMIKGLVKNNKGEEALRVFSEFKITESEPDGSMFLGVFAACRLVGDVPQGMLHFKSMIKQYGITPSMKHYVSIVNMMGHVGHLEEAMEFIEKMPVEPSIDVWETMMNVCRLQGNTELGDRCAEAVQLLDPTRLTEESKAGLIPVKTSDMENEQEDSESKFAPVKGQNLVEDEENSSQRLPIPLN